MDNQQIIWKVAMFKRDDNGKLKFSRFITDCVDKDECLNFVMRYHNENSSPTIDFYLIRISNGVFYATKNGYHYRDINLEIAYKFKE